MSLRAEHYKAEIAHHQQIRAFYAAIRRPWLEIITFGLALLGSILVSLRRFGIGITDYEHQGQWLTVYYWVALLLFVSADSIFCRTRRPDGLSFGGFNPLEKFAAQGRLWQIALVLMLPITARVIVAAVALNS